MKKSRYLDYVKFDNLIVPILFMDSDDYIKLVGESAAGRMEIIHKQKKRRA